MKFAFEGELEELYELIPRMEKKKNGRRYFNEDESVISARDILTAKMILQTVCKMNHRAGGCQECYFYDMDGHAPCFFRNYSPLDWGKSEQIKEEK